MGIGRITGPLLANNLLRDGRNLAVETDLLYLDVTNGRIGVKNATPQYNLDVQNNARIANISFTATNTSSIILNTVGNLIISSGGDDTDIVMRNNLSVEGNIHAVGNITAGGNVQIGNGSGSDVVGIFANVISDIVPQTDNEYNIGSEQQSWATAYVNSLIASKLVSPAGQEINIGMPLKQDVNITDITNPTINLNGPVRIWGDNPLGTAPITSNVLYVTMDGSDTNDGRAQDPSRACRTITGALRSPFYQPGTSIKVAAGRYYENNPLELKPYTSVIGSDLRTTVIEPINKTQDLFHVQSGCYLAQMLFANGQSGLLPGPGYKPGTNRGAYATAFPPNYSSQKIDLYHSPYIQNCTNQSGPWLQDGTMFLPNQTVQIPQAVGTATWIVNTTTLRVVLSEGTLSVGQSINAGPTPQSHINARTLLLANKPFIQEQVIAYIGVNYPTFVYNKATYRRDIGVIVENIAYDAAFGGNEKSVEGGLLYWDGVTSVIADGITQTASAINYINTLSQYIIANNTATNLLGQAQLAPQVINYNLTGGSSAGSVITNLIGIISTVVQSGPSSAPQIQAGNGPDWGSVSAEVLLQSNRSFIQNEVVSYVNSTYPDFVYREDLCYRDTGLIIDAISQDIILNANAKTIEAGKTYWTGNISAVTGQITETVNALSRAKDISLQIVNNTTVTTTAFTFNSTKCARDTGLIVDAIAQDLLFGGNSQSTFAGIQYWNHGDYVGEIGNEITTTTNAIKYISSLTQRIILNQLVTPLQNVVSQVTATSTATAAEVTIIRNEFNIITDILTSGTVGVTNLIVPNRLTPSTTASVITAYDLIQNNVNFLKEEAIAWVEQNKNFRYTTATCARDVGLIVDSIVLDLNFPTTALSQSTFAGLQYWNQGGYTGDIGSEVTATVNAISHLSEIASYVIVNNTSSGVRYAGVQPVTNLPAAGASEQSFLTKEFTTITNIILNGTTGTTDQIISNGIVASSSSTVNNAYNILQANKAYLQAETVAYVEATKSPGFVYNTSTCYRDVGYMIDSVSFDLLYGGNRQAIQSGVYYYSFNGSTAVPNEIEQVISAYKFILGLSSSIIRNDPVNALQTTVDQVYTTTSSNITVFDDIDEIVTRITDIIEYGPGVVDVKQPISLTKTNEIMKEYAAKNLLANKDFIKAETIAYIDKYLVFQYDPETCRRDVGYILNSVSFDLLYGGNRQAIQSGVYYWGYSNVSTALPKERSATTLAYQYMKRLMSDIVVNNRISTTYQTSSTQVTGLSPATQIEVDAISVNIDKIVNIINRGPQTAGAKTPIGLVRSNNVFVQNAANFLSANRDFIQKEVNAFVSEMLVNNAQVFLPFYSKGSQATLSITRNFNIISDIIEKGPGVAPIISQGNGIFIKTGLSPDDIKIAPVITNITTITTGVYQVDISQSTIGFGDSTVLYFGETAVFPLLDNDVPDRWQQRRINPIGSMGGSLVDGKVISDRSPIKSFVYDAYTQVNQGGRGVHVINNGYAQLVSVFTIFCSDAVTVENGGICSITNSNSNFGDICLAAKGYGFREFSGYIKNPPVLPYFPNGFYPQRGTVQVYIADPRLRPHIALVMEVEPPADFVNNQGLPGFLSGNTSIATLTTGTITISGIDNTGMVIGQKVFVRDQFGRTYDSNGEPYIVPGTLVADVSYQSVTLNYPLNSGGGDPNNSNYFSLYTCGNAYYTVLSSTVAEDKFSSNRVLKAYNLLQANRTFLQQETVAFVEATKTLGFSYNTSTCYRDVGYIVDSISFDLLYGGNRQATQSGVYYYNFAGSTSIPGETTATVAAFNYIGTLSNKIIQGTTITPLQTVIPQFKNGNYGTISEANSVTNNISIINDIIINGPAGYAKTPISLNRSTNPNVLNAARILSANRSFIQAEVIKFVSNNYPLLSYTTATCRRDTGLIVDSLVQDLLYSTSSQSTFSGMQYWNQTGYTGGIASEITTTTAAISYLKSIAENVVQGIVSPGYSTGTQVTNLPYSTEIEAKTIGSDFDVILNILNNGTAGVSDAIIPNSIDPIGAGYSLLPSPQNVEELYSLQYLSTITQYIVANTTVTNKYGKAAQIFDNSLVGGSSATTFITDRLALIGSIIVNGPDSAPAITRTGVLPSGAASAASLLNKNRAFIQDEVVSFVNITNYGFTYSEDKCSRDSGLIVDAIAQDILFSTSSQSTFAGLQYWNQGGYSGTLPSEINTTTSAIRYISSLTQQIILSTTGTRYQSVSSQVTSGNIGSNLEVYKVKTEFNTIVDILVNGTASVSDIIQPNSLTSSTNVNVINAYNLLQSNKNYIKDEFIAYINSTTVGFSYNEANYRRDIGYIVDSVSFDILYGGNRQAVQSGVYYYSYNTSSSAISNYEITPTIDAYNYINSLTTKIILGQAITPKQTKVARVFSTTATSVESNLAQTNLNLIKTIIQDGPTGYANTPISLTRSTSTNKIAAATILQDNRKFIQAEVIAYINNKYLPYNQTKCRRDVGFIVDAIIYDLDKGGNYNSVIAGKSYFATSGTYHVVSLEENITDPALFPDDAIVTFYQRSYMSASGYLFEYVGAGTNYGSLPQVGRADPVQSKEVVQLNNGKVFFTSTDQNGDFRIGPGLVISQATGVLSGRTFTKSLFANLTPFILAIEG